MKRNIRWARNRRGIIFFYVFIIISLFLIVYERNVITNLRYKNTELEDKLNRERTINKELMVEIARLSSAERIEALAKSYNLVNISPSQIVFMKDVDVASLKREREKSQGILAIIFNASAVLLEK